MERAKITEGNEMKIETILIRFMESLRDYNHESGNDIWSDERESKEFVDIFVKEQELKDPKAFTDVVSS